ncbi:MAG: methylmalonyl-CoA mutase family protein [Acidimicrobiia bacterium]|nr:methylmalonyl-CoA mutase family protein [Acidimicrobiia bacterium]
MHNPANPIPSRDIPLDVVHGPPTSEPDLGAPGEYPFTRGPYPTMYTGRPWTMRQYAGFGSATATNQRFRALLAGGQTGLSVAFDLPTQMGLDSDDPRAEGEVGKVGVAIDTLADMRVLFADIPLGEVTTSMTINATAAILLLLYQLVAEEQGVTPAGLGGTVQNDILKEYVARGTYIYPPAPSMRLVTDLFAYCAAELPDWNTISISGYHIREAGSTAAEEIGFTIANGLAYVEAAQAAGLAVDDFAPRLSFFWNAHSNFLEEVAKYRAARRLWARLMRDRVGARQPASWRMRFHTQTAGSSLTAQQPLTNVVRTTLEALSAVLGGTQSLHTNSFDEALGLPTEEAAMLALRTQQVIAHESGVTDTVDPLAGSYVIEHLTDQLEAKALAIVDRVAAAGGAVAAIETGMVQAAIEESAYRTARAVDSAEQVIVGLNAYVEDGATGVPPLELDPDLEADQIASLKLFKEGREDVDGALEAIGIAAAGSDNVLFPMKAALAAGATVGEVSDVLREVFGEYRP